MVKSAGIVALVLLTAGCGKSPSEKLAGLVGEFVETTLSFSPSTATGVGFHKFQKQNLDGMLEDFSPASVAHQRAWYNGLRERLRNLDQSKFTPEDRADAAILEDQASLALLEFDSIQNYQHNPATYVEILGSALFTPYMLEYAPKAERVRHIIARLQKVPLYLDQARSNLSSSPEIWANVAVQENDGNIALLEKTITPWVPDDQRANFSRAEGPALAAMRQFSQFLQTRLVGRQDAATWRTGKNYAMKFRYTMETGIEFDAALLMAENRLRAVRANMLELALPLHQRMFPAHKDHAELSGADRENKIIGETLAKISDRHSTRESYMDDARADLEEARAFVQAKHLLTLPGRANLQVIPTPEFMRGIYSVGGFNPAPALEPQLGAFYWVTPIPAGWPKEQVESKLREYNFYKLKLLTIHEAMPGHYVQAEIANDVQPRNRRLLRAVYGNGPYVEGWAEFVTQAMLDEGFLDHSPEIALTFAKEELRVIANAILDIRLQSQDMTDEDALALMEKQTFQEHEEAVEKLQRAKLSSAQLPTYYLGWLGWNKVRDEYQKAKGGSYSPSEFRDRALKEGAVPIAVLGNLLK